MDKEMAARSVTIVGGSNRLSRMVDSRLGRSQSRKTKLDSVRDNSPTGSEASIIKSNPLSDGIQVQVETKIQVSRVSTDDDAIIPTRERSHSPPLPHAR